MKTAVWVAMMFYCIHKQPRRTNPNGKGGQVAKQAR
jgi:hypothetical protein